MEPPAPTRSSTATYAAQFFAFRRRQRTRRRLLALGSFLLLGLALGNVWATGFAVVGGTTGTAYDAAPYYFDPGNKQDRSGLNGLLTSGGDLTFNWEGSWGYVDSLAMYTADLDTLSPSDNYFIGVYLTNTPSGFSDLQLQLRIKDDGNDGTCTATDIKDVADTDDYRVFTFDAADSQVTFSGMNGASTGLPGGTTYCVGVDNYTGSGQDPAGTFIRRSRTGPTFTGIEPTFVAAVNDMLP